MNATRTGDVVKTLKYVPTCLKPKHKHKKLFDKHKDQYDLMMKELLKGGENYGPAQ
jgi:hypothetical protein